MSLTWQPTEQKPADDDRYRILIAAGIGALMSMPIWAAIAVLVVLVQGCR